MNPPERREDVLTIGQDFYIRATSPLADNRTSVLKYGETFGVFNRYGDIESIGTMQFGLFHMETRHLSRLSFYLGGRKPLLLSSSIREDNSLLAVDATNLDTQFSETDHLPQGTIHMFRSASLSKAVYHGQFRFQNYGTQAHPLLLAFSFDADFADIFQVRGTPRKKTGQRLEDRIEDNSLILSYDGLDGVRRQTRISFSQVPKTIIDREMTFAHELKPEEEWTLSLTVLCERFGPEAKSTGVDNTSDSASGPVFRTRLVSSNKRCDSWLARCQADLSMLMDGNPEKDYPYAGVPWFSTVFGRDGIITAMECLWIAPAIARGVLAYLAKTQATEEDPSRDAEPGKIIHEIRHGEMAATGEVPFGRYYGSVDSTPLFVMLAGFYFQRTNDLEFAENIWPQIVAALRWIDKYGDVDGDGFYEYHKRSEKGLVQQGWKDSYDSIFHRDGRLAGPPIALCEMQGYVYAAKQAAAVLCERLGLHEMSSRLATEARELQSRFDQTFWNEELKTYAIALDGEKRQCEVRTSNAGHALFTKIASAARARIVSETLLDGASYSGWGIRTVAAREARYNPMSYHNGSVWPHDNALIGAGLAHYGQQHLAARLLGGMFDAGRHVDLNRLPELFCGFHRRPDGTGPTLYPVACAPQAWASGCPYLLLCACLGFEINAGERLVRFDNPHLPSFLDELRVEGLDVGDARVDLRVVRHEKGFAVDVTKKEGEVEVQVRV
ncbi:MAG: amylo-alpha-1,6-glucosidase [Candidatus Acidiferrum sp.]